MPLSRRLLFKLGGLLATPCATIQPGSAAAAPSSQLLVFGGLQADLTRQLGVEAASWAGSVFDLCAALHAAGVAPAAALDIGDSLTGTPYAWHGGGPVIGRVLDALAPTLHVPHQDLLRDDGPAIPWRFASPDVVAMPPVPGMNPAIGALSLVSPIILALLSRTEVSATPPVEAVTESLHIATRRLRAEGASLLALVLRRNLPDGLGIDQLDADLVVMPCADLPEPVATRLPGQRWLLRVPAGRPFALLLPLEAGRLASTWPGPRALRLGRGDGAVAPPIAALLAQIADSCAADAMLSPACPVPGTGSLAEEVLRRTGADVALWLPTRPLPEARTRPATFAHLPGGPAARVTVRDLSGIDLLAAMATATALCAPLDHLLPAAVQRYGLAPDPAGGWRLTGRGEAVQPTASYRLASWGLPGAPPGGCELASLLAGATPMAPGACQAEMILGDREA
ncbi:hypothetical protein [Falsiroseomonas sp.]|uniref:hypothetical protein n=1 Tax=Falsiroseomonas sp. TaxID=2870721 RepID=UPI003F70D4EE